MLPKIIFECENTMTLKEATIFAVKWAKENNKILYKVFIQNRYDDLAECYDLHLYEIHIVYEEK